jgi:hypothetical protein
MILIVRTQRVLPFGPVNGPRISWVLQPWGGFPVWLGLARHQRVIGGALNRGALQNGWILVASRGS